MPSPSRSSSLEPMFPLQLLSSPSQISTAPGWMLASESSQSVLSLTYPAGWLQLEIVSPASPYPSPSSSAYQVTAPPSSSMEPSQSSSMPLQASVAPGLTLPSVSSQSVLSAMYPGGAVHPVVLSPASPYPSPSSSAYQVVAPPSSSMLPSQSLSMPSQMSVSPGLMAASVSSQSSWAPAQPTLAKKPLPQLSPSRSMQG